MMENDELGATWRSELLHGLATIPHTGAVPGGLVVWGEAARAILNSSQCDEPLIAAAELGCGRVIVVAHEGLIKTASVQIRDNLERWLTRGDDELIAGRHVLSGTSNAGDLRPRGLLEWLGGSTGSVTGNDVINHVVNGGSLLHAMCPWGWLQLNPGKTFANIPLFDVLCVAGIGYTESYGNIPQSGLNVMDHCASEKSHAMLMVNHLLQDLDLSRDDVPASNFMAIPREVRKQIIIPKVKQMCMALESSGSGKLKSLTPEPTCPVKGKCCRAVMNVLECAAWEEDSGLALPGVDTFPGSFSCQPHTICAVVEICTSFQDVHSTGYYLPPKCALIVQVPPAVNCEGWHVQVGAHTDQLHHVKELRRWPKVTTKQQLTTGSPLRMYSPFGGLVYVESPATGGQISIQLQNVVEAPQFVLNRPTPWDVRRNAPGLWADFVGETIMITLPSSSIRNLNDPTDVMRTWDRIVRTHHDLRGTDPAGQRKQWIVCDEQPSVGYMHAGTPIVTHLDIARPDHELFILNNTMLENKGTWGLFHELGHNMQRSSWTFSGTTEVTCNIFTLHAMEVISGKSLWIHEWLKNQLGNVKRYLNSSSEGFTKWQSDPGIALFLYAQIAHHFGWEPYKQAFRTYEKDQTFHLPSDEIIIETWFTRISQACGYNLGPLFDLWKVPVSDHVMQSIRLPYILPDDEITQMNVGLVSRLLQKYPNCCRKAPPVPSSAQYLN